MTIPAVVIAHGGDLNTHTLVRRLKAESFHCIAVDCPQQLEDLTPAVLLLDAKMLSGNTLQDWRVSSDMIIITPESVAAEGDLIAADGWPERSTVKLLRLACQQWVYRREQRQLTQALHRTQGHLSKMADVGIALSAEQDLSQLLSKILTEGQRLAGCDACSLFLVDKSDVSMPKLTFKLTQNASIPSPFKQQQLMLTKSSIAGYVAITGTELNIEDAYNIPVKAPYSFNDSFDKAMGYRSVSLLAIPMRDYRQEIIGVLEFINRKRDPSRKLDNPAAVKEHTLPFDQESATLLRALAGQASVAIENRQLIDSINQLFDSFVQASVVAIEQRDPATSGHSFRVADLCVQLAQVIPLPYLSRHRRQAFTQEEIREIRFAALLHDFGKVGVREHVLVKAKKLSETSIETLRYRIALAKESVHNRCLYKLLNLYEKEGAIDKSFQKKVFDEIHQEELLLNRYLEQILAANEPTVLPQGSFEDLQDIRNYLAKNCNGLLTGLISEQEFLDLSLRKGSLTSIEREEIQSHVLHTLNFLQLIPWTPELQRVPEIAGAHHEKLDGSGYPNGLMGAQIPLPSKIMAICDIYDALTAIDRPYKAAMPIEQALKILEDEACMGMLDEDLVKIFVESKSYEIVQQENYTKAGQSAASYYQRHACDYHLHQSFDH